MNRPEQQLQISIVHYLRVACPDLVFFHPANGGYRTPREASLMKAMGVVAGTPDFVFCLPGGRFGSCELKSPKGRLSDAQAAFAQRVVAADGYWAEVRSLEDLERTLHRWGVKTRVAA